jgi:hypothetical protein
MPKYTKDDDDENFCLETYRDVNTLEEGTNVSLLGASSVAKLNETGVSAVGTATS